MNKYQGWANWHTWNTALWLNNTEWSYKEAKQLCHSIDSRGKLASALRFLAATAIPQTEGINYDQVNWDEIIDDFRSE